MADRLPGAPRGRGAGALAVALLVVLWGTPLLLLVFGVANAKEQQSASTSGPKAHVVTVGSRELDGRRAVTLTARLGAVPDIATDELGIVTRVHVVENESVRNGAALVDVDGKTISAFSDETPLFRDLTEGDRGPDVSALSRFLVAVGDLDASAVDDEIGPRIRSAIVVFQKANRYEADGVFRPG